MMNDKKYVIFDLDNCISDDSWRIRFIDWTQKSMWERYKDYHRGCGMDEPGNLHLFREWTKDYIPVFCTGRPLIVRMPTEYWIRKHLGISKPILLMRNNDDHRKSFAVKEDMVDSLYHHYDIIPEMAFDDRPEIIRMYLDNDIAAKQVFIHDPDDSYVPPDEKK
jgi:hypothetical protein